MRSRTFWLIGVVMGAVLFSTSACDEDEPPRFAPADCVREPPKTGLVRLQVRIDTEHVSIPVKIFRGSFENDVVVVTDTLTVETADYELAPDVDYSAAAQYQVGSGRVIAIDGGRLNLSYTDYQDARCWNVSRLSLDLRLED